MTRFGMRISLLAAASLLFANIACTCAVAGTHAWHMAASDDAAHQVHQPGGHLDAHAAHHHGSAALADAPQQNQETEPADPSCHLVLSDCPDCGAGVMPTIKQDRELRVPWMQSELGDKTDLSLASLGAALDTKLAYARAYPSGAWRPCLPAFNSPITRKDQLTE